MPEKGKKPLTTEDSLARDKAGLARYGYSGERSEQEWLCHWDTHTEMYAAIYAVVFHGFRAGQVNHVISAHYSTPPKVEDWVYNRVPGSRKKAS